MAGPRVHAGLHSRAGRLMVVLVIVIMVVHDFPQVPDGYL
jgi:hypothetical protein